MKSLTFNNIKKDWIYLLKGRKKAPFSPVDRTLITLPGLNGAYLSKTSLSPLSISQPVGFFIENDVQSLDFKDELASWLYSDDPVELQFDDEPGRTYYAVVQNTLSDFEKIAYFRQGTIEFLCLDPYGYGEEQTHNFSSDIELIEAKGTADSDPIFELEVLAPVTFAMIANENNEYNLIGIPTDVDEEIVDTKSLLLEERGDTLDTWDTSPISIDGGEDTGTMSTDADGITVPDYGTGSKWHGPGLIKEVDMAQDFEVEMHCQGMTKKIDETFRIEFYLFDENMEVLGKMAMLDNSSNLHDRRAEGRYGPFEGNKVHYPIHTGNYQYNWDFFFGLLRMTRVGNRFEFYVTRVATNTKHVYSLRKTFVDNDNKYAGRLKFIQIHIGKYGDTSKAYSAKINYIRAYELSQVKVDQTPYIAYPGDKITFDHKEDDILINGETIFGEGNQSVEKSFGADFFKLKKGLNNLIVHPSDSFKTKLKYRPRYR